MKQRKKRIRKHQSNMKLVQKYLVQSGNIGLPLVQLVTLVIRVNISLPLVQLETCALVSLLSITATRRRRKWPRSHPSLRQIQPKGEAAGWEAAVAAAPSPPLDLVGGEAAAAAVAYKDIARGKKEARPSSPCSNGGRCGEGCRR